MIPSLARCVLVAMAASILAATADAQEANSLKKEPSSTREAIRRVANDKVAGEHPLKPTMRLAEAAVERLEKIKDYSATLIRRERIGGRLQDYDYQYVKVRHKPFSVYVYFQAPRRGSEVIYVEGKNNGKVWAHEVGTQGGRLVGTVSLDPEGPRARKESLRPITQMGLLNLTRRIVAFAERESKFGECEVKLLNDAKINDRGCLCIEVTHPVRRREFKFHVLRIFFDDEWGIPTRFEGFSWPNKRGGEPVLEEEYTFVNLKLDRGFTDEDFDVANPKYRFPPKR